MLAQGIIMSECRGKQHGRFPRPLGAGHHLHQLLSTVAYASFLAGSRSRDGWIYSNSLLSVSNKRFLNVLELFSWDVRASKLKNHVTICQPPGLKPSPFYGKWNWENISRFLIRIYPLQGRLFLCSKPTHWRVLGMQHESNFFERDWKRKLCVSSQA